MVQLRQFARALMNYVVNDTKTSAEKVTSTLNDYQQEASETNAIEDAKLQFYMTNIELPRAERQRTYQEYVDQRSALREAYIQNPNYGKLREWLSSQLPETLDKGVNEPYIYTKNIVVK